MNETLEMFQEIGGVLQVYPEPQSQSAQQDRCSVPCSATKAAK